jgi:hypothetical protein|tara:strand:- start:21999 stop:22802 length:804 start_codon:yes stop_codon:yes gene_type:complete
MPSFNQHASNTRTKIMVTGDSGSGKTGLLSTLANDGYNLRILDFDNGLDILNSFLDEGAKDRVHYATLRDTMKTATAYAGAVKLIENWKTEDEDFGPVKDWTDKDVLVIDSLTFLANSAMRFVLGRDGKKFTDQPAIQHWGEAGRNVEGLIQYLTSDDIKCNLVVNTHVQYYDDPMGGRKAYPVALGTKLPTVIGRYFNCLVRIDVKPSKTGGTRILRTVSDHKMDLKNTAPNLIEPDAELDLAAIFKAVQSQAKSNNKGVTDAKKD